MNEHTLISNLLPLYVSGALDRPRRDDVEKHLAVCAECQSDLALWKAVSVETRLENQSAAAPYGLADRAINSIQPARPMISQIKAKLQRALYLLRSQMPLVQREIWPASAAVIGLGYAAALIADQAEILYALAPLIAATCVSLIYGPENDPGYELSLSTPTAPRQILLARLALVFGYNLALVLLAAIGLLPLIDKLLLGSLLLSWLAPMTFLSAVALALSLWIGAPNAIVFAYIAWLGELISRLLRAPQSPIELSPITVQIMTAYQHFWQTPMLLLAMAVLLFGVAAWLAGRKEQSLLGAT